MLHNTTTMSGQTHPAYTHIQRGRERERNDDVLVDLGWEIDIQRAKRTQAAPVASLARVYESRSIGLNHTRRASHQIACNDTRSNRGLAAGCIHSHYNGSRDFKDGYTWLTPVKCEWYLYKSLGQPVIRSTGMSNTYDSSTGTNILSKK